MNFEFNPDQQALLDAVERIALDYEAQAQLGAGPWERSAALEADLDAAGVFDAAGIEELGPVAAAAMVLRLARLPQCTELIASALVVPLLAPSLPRPCAVLWEDRSRPARWLPGAQSVLCMRGAVVEALDSRMRGNDREAARHPGAGGDPELPLSFAVTPLDTPFGYPVGRLIAPDAFEWKPLDIDAPALRRLWRLGVAAELTGCLDAGLRSVVAHVRDRRQFGRPLGAFQAVQHRLAQCAVQVEAARWLTLQAAFTGSDADAITAAAQVQQAAPALIYDLHQFMGAMGLTLEHPLHRWTTRAKMLRADLGGAQTHFRALADLAWGAAHTQRQETATA